MNENGRSFEIAASERVLDVREISGLVPVARHQERLGFSLTRKTTKPKGRLLS